MLNVKNSHFILFAGLLAVFIFTLVAPVSAELQTINKDTPIFIGESNLDISNAASSGNTLGWYASGSTVANPDYAFEIPSANPFYVDQDRYLGRTTIWYIISRTGNIITKGDPVFSVQDPQISVAIWDFKKSKDITDQPIVRGDHIGVKVITNMYVVTNTQNRPNADSSTDGFINIKIQKPSGEVITDLVRGTSDTSTPTTTLNQYVTSQPWYFGTASNYWVTDAKDSSGQYLYPSGTYTIWAESELNNMIDNYRYAGFDYTGKTISKSRTITIIDVPVSTQTSTSSTPTLTSTSTYTSTPTPAITTTITTLQTSSVPTTIISSIPTSAQPTTTITQSTGTPTITTRTPRPTSTINYSATIEALQKQVDEQDTKIKEQGSWIDMILQFLGLK